MEQTKWKIDAFINLIYPKVCGICGKLSAHDLCKKCEINLNHLAQFQVDCYRHQAFRKHFFIFKYEGSIKEMLIHYKFDEQVYLYKAFVNFILKNEKLYRFLKNYDIIIPVPIHTERKITRGYNQSALLAKEIAKKSGALAYTEKVLFKKINNRPQSSQNKQERKTNVTGVYVTKHIDPIQQKRVLLLDDIFTTGSTVNECAKVLKQSGARKVDVLTIAKD